MTGAIWLIGGTQESRWIAQLIVCQGFPCWVSVTTAAACHLYDAHPLLSCHIERLTPERAREFIEQHSIRAVVDASHPFAVAISALAIAISQEFGLPYLRFERPAFPPVLGIYTDLPTLLQGNLLMGERVLLTLGVKHLAAFVPLQRQATLFARILPTTSALEAALAAGFDRQRLIAIFPPVSRELERALWQQWQITTVVTKASGTESEQIKQAIARELGVKLITLQRPPMVYPRQTSDRAGIEAFLQELATSKQSDQSPPPNY
ncbi:cobalt-precorrin-6A reductase [Thermosynechococcus sp. CL-1]|uniref:cobalt-precorrin-6A reductase n=1 Tax=unclassified Thermosynechococcus TaxID=2622553 RepID=UPI00122E25E7|nr:MULTISPECIES: cobalt-precorrin-6A reductase [unclassified Thermosynechococcus]QEQ01948.1 cobalt-precorrin-6A reductase [Thermosynechococcus sp. CL-1]WKT83463.1 cobalt-precorrin-6A reductase [Thermosynechococcus sp. HY596]WNC62594.1 cobalt-precorrin-6A reductase [Thermosynechococcus sp. HY591]WNC65151.1 cobalt-precorrin-6A reductase [Thermosynechococcus sp. HY593]